MPHSTQLWEGDHLNEPTLRQFLNGNLSADVAFQMEGHLATCKECRSRLDRIIREGDAADASLVALTQAFARKGFASPLPQLGPTTQRYPDFETIAAYVDGTLAHEKAAELEALMSQLPRLAQEVAELRALKEDLGASPIPDSVGTATIPSLDVVPPMILKQRGTLTSSKKNWWAQWRWPLQSLGVATATALFLFVVWKPSLQKSQQVEQLKNEIEQSQSKAQVAERRLAGEKQKSQRLQRNVRNTEKEKQALNAQNQQLRQENARLKLSLPSGVPAPSRPDKESSEPTIPGLPKPTSVIPAKTAQPDETAVPETVPSDSSAGQIKEQAYPYTLKGNRIIRLEDSAIIASARPGSIIEVPSEKIITRGSPSQGGQLQLQIIRVNGNEIEVANPSGVPLSPRGKVRLLTISLASKPLLVGLSYGVTWSNPVVKRLATLSDSRYFRLAYPSEKPDVTLALGSRRQVFSLSNSVPSTSKPDQRGYYISGGAGKPIFGFFVPVRPDGNIDSADELKIKKALENYSIQSRLLALRNPEGQSLLRSVAIETFQGPGYFDKQGRWHFNGPTTRRPLSQKVVVKVNDAVQFQFKNRTGKTLYIAMLWLFQDGNVAPIRKEFKSDEPPSSVIQLNPKGTSGANSATVYCQAIPPAGAEKIKLFITTQPFDSTYLNRDKSGSAQTDENELSSLDVLLGQAMGTRPQVKDTDPVDFKNWAATTHEIFISEK